MNKDIAAGKWKQLKGKVQQKWGDLTDDDFDKVQGSEERFVGLLQERYGLMKEEAEREFQKLVASLSPNSTRLAKDTTWWTPFYTPLWGDTWLGLAAQ